MTQRSLAALVLVAALWPCFARAAGTEAILDFRSDIVVGADAALTVTETIRVRSTGAQIRRGIYRDFPTEYPGPWGTRSTVSFHVVKVLRDGRPDGWRTKRIDGGVRVYIGHENVRLKPGVYTYTLTYRTDRQVGFFDAHDELYWNATGNFWSFPIQAASARVTLPPSVPKDAITVEAYTGPVGAKGADYAALVAADVAAEFRSTRVLPPGHGLTVVVTWPKGHVAEPTGDRRRAAFFRDNLGLLVGGGGVVLVTLYFIVTWSLVGRDPLKGLIIPLFEPPEDLSPAGLRFLRRMDFDLPCVSAAVVDMAVKRHLDIVDDDGTYKLQRCNGDGAKNLTFDEKCLSRGLFRSGKRLTLKNTNASTVSKATKNMEKALRASALGRLFRANPVWFRIGVGLALAVLVGTALLHAPNPAVLFILLWLTGWSVACVVLVRTAYSAWRKARGNHGGALRKVGLSAAAVMPTLFAAAFSGAWLFVFGFLVTMTSLWLLPVVAVLLGLVLLFRHLLKAPNREGRELMDRIDGFRMYLATAEGDSLDALHPPEKTPELFERYLPYAIACGVENRWADQFADVLAEAALEDDYRPVWYAGGTAAHFSAAAFASSIGGSLSSAVASSSHAPGSSSGSGGGGSSGGGGGGGGGGGW